MRRIFLSILLMLIASPALAQEKLAKQSQNPVGNIISLPVEFHHYDGVADDGDVNAMFLKPVYPTRIGKFNLINRGIIPLLDVDAEGGGNFDNVQLPPVKIDETGLGNIQYQGFISPADASDWIWGVGPVIEFPTHSDDLGNDNYSAGPAAVLLTMPGDWVIGILAQNIWSIGGGGSDTPDVNKTTLQYFVNYNLSNGWYLTSSPVNTANWEADSGDEWTVPIGGGVGRLVRFGKQPVDFKFQGFGYLENPDSGADWNVQFMVKFLFVK